MLLHKHNSTLGVRLQATDHNDALGADLPRTVLSEEKENTIPSHCTTSIKKQCGKMGACYGDTKISACTSLPLYSQAWWPTRCHERVSHLWVAMPFNQPNNQISCKLLGGSIQLARVNFIGHIPGEGEVKFRRNHVFIFCTLLVLEASFFFFLLTFSLLCQCQKINVKLQWKWLVQSFVIEKASHSMNLWCMKLFVHIYQCSCSNLLQMIGYGG